MSVIRTKKNRDYFVANNQPFNDERLSWESRGVMGYLLSKPDGWECRNYDLVNKGPAGSHVIKRVMKELQEYGYLRRFRVSDGRGGISWMTEIYEKPEMNPDFTKVDFSTVVNSTVEFTTVEKSHDIVSTNSASTNSAKTDKVKTPVSPKSSDDQESVLDSLFSELVELLKIDVALYTPTMKRNYENLIQDLQEAGAEPGDITSYGAWWYENDWRGQRKQPPTLHQVRETWQQFIDHKAGAKVAFTF